tara:strand:- start:89 stop:1261 length:1173 start_codon:yes stop_codon:yes gene_type:complete
MINIKRSLYAIVTFSFLFQLIKFFSFFEEYSDWQYVDWIINYQGGFVRRGLIGEFLFKVYELTRINLDILILVFVSLIIFFNSYFLFKSIKYIYNSYINILIFLSPGFFLYSIMNSEIIGRKDILMIFVMGFLVFFEKKISNRSIFLLFTLLIIVLCLSHSGFIFYTPYILFLFFLIKSNRKEKIKFFEIISTVSILILILFLILFNQGTELHVQEICASVKNFVSEKCTSHGQIKWLQNDLNNYLYEKTTTGVDYFQSLFVYLISFILVYFFLGLKIYKSKFRINYYSLNKINPLLIFILLFLATLPSYILALDWGRYIFISYSSSFFIFIYCLKENLISTNYDLKLNKFIFTIIIIFYSFFWTFPFYSATNFKLIFKKPIISILKHIG